MPLATSNPGPVVVLSEGLPGRDQRCSSALGSCCRFIARLSSLVPRAHTYCWKTCFSDGKLCDLVDNELTAVGLEVTGHHLSGLHMAISSLNAPRNEYDSSSSDGHPQKYSRPIGHAHWMI